MSDILGQSVRSFKENLNDLLNSLQYLFDNDMINIVHGIMSGLDKLRLENTLIKQSNPNERVILELLADGPKILNEVRTELNKIVNKSNDNKTNVYKQAAKMSLFTLNESLQPYFKQSQLRLDNYSDHLGATDRYLGYRNNLTRFNTPIKKPRSVWEDTTQVNKYSTPDYREESAKYQKAENTRLLNQRAKNESNTLNRPNSSHFMKSALDKTTLDYQTDSQKDFFTKQKSEKEFLIQYGIHPIYPDKSEYSYSFVKPTSYPVHYAPITINPQPSHKHFDRKFATHKIEPRPTEYQIQFKFPDAKRTIRYPWIHNY